MTSPDDDLDTIETIDDVWDDQVRLVDLGDKDEPSWRERQRSTRLEDELALDHGPE